MLPNRSKLSHRRFCGMDNSICSKLVCTWPAVATPNLATALVLQGMCCSRRTSRSLFRLQYHFSAQQLLLRRWALLFNYCCRL